MLLHFLPLLFFTFVNSDDDPSLMAGTAALPLVFKAKRLHQELKVNKTQFESTTAKPLEVQATPQDYPKQQEFVEPKREKTTPANLLLSRWKGKVPTTVLNDRPLISQLTTPSFRPSPAPSIPATSTVTTLNDLLQSLLPSTRSTTLAPAPSPLTKLALRSAKHHRVTETVGRNIEDMESTISPQATTPYEQRGRCTQEQSKELINSATTCKNERSDRVCSLLFEDPDPKTGRRDQKCNVAGMEDIANSCRRQCGICCEHIDFACEDDSNKIIDCNKQLDKCQMSKWFDVLARFCAGSCGLCTRTACRDFSPKCREMKNLCLDEGHIDFMRANCSRTCGFCVVGPGGASENPLKRLPVPQCIDHAANCTENEALCSSPMHAEFMIKYCAKTCFKCTADSTSSQVIVPVIGTSPELNGTAAVLLPASMIMGAARPDPNANECVDHHPKCAIWVAKGFCTHNKYTNEQRFALCPKSCKLC